MRKLILGIFIMLDSVFSNAQAITTWSVGTVAVDCQTEQICYPIMVQTTIANSQLSFTTLRFLYDPMLLTTLTIGNIENGYVVTLEQETSPLVGNEFGFSTDEARFPRISISPNIANYLDIQNGIPSHVFDLCFTILSDPIPAELCSPLVFDYNHTAEPGIANDAGYFVGDAGLATQYVLNSAGSAIAADDDAIQFLWIGNPAFDGVLDMPGEIVGSAAITNCIPTNCMPLAIELLEFRAFRVDERVQLEWSTTYEDEKSHFDIQRGIGSLDFLTIGQADEGHLVSTVMHYSFYDYSPGEGPNYYRLMQVDSDGEISYSHIETVIFGGVEEVRVAPNPISDALTLSIHSSASKENTYTVGIYSTTGQLLMQINIQGIGFFQKVMDVSELADGLYIIEVRDGSEVMHTEKLVKQN